MTGADFFAIFCFIIAFKVITSLKLRGVSADDPSGAAEVEVAPPNVAPMHMPIQIPRPQREKLAPDKLVTEKIVLEKLVVDGSIPGKDDPGS